MAEQFLSCDGNFLQFPRDNFKQNKKEAPSTMISISTISASLSTDDSSAVRRKEIPVEKFCCVLPVNTVAIFGVTLTAILTLAAYIFCMINILKTEEGSRARAIALFSVISLFILLFAAMFAWGVFATRQNMLLPFITLSTFLLFAMTGICIFSFVTAASEVGDEVSKENTSSKKVADLLLYRIILTLASVVQALFVYLYIRSYLYTRRLFHSRRR